MIAADIVARARELDLLQVALRLGFEINKKKSSRFEKVGGCPGCGGDDRFGVNTAKGKWHCRGRYEGGRDPIGMVMHVVGCGFPEAIEWLIGRQDLVIRPPRPKAGSGDELEEERRLRRFALGIFDGAKSVRGTLAETNLVRVRHIDLDQIPEVDDVLRYAPACPFGKGRKLPCLVSLVRNILTNEPQAIQRVALDASGRKIDRMSLGGTKGGAIKLWGDDWVTTFLVGGEGMESVAAAATRVPYRGGPLQPAWSLIDRIGVRDLPVLAGVGALVLIADHDESGDGQAAARTCRERWRDAGRDTVILTPSAPGADFSDIVAEGDDDG